MHPAQPPIRRRIKRHPQRSHVHQRHEGAEGIDGVLASREDGRVVLDVVLGDVGGEGVGDGGGGGGEVDDEGFEDPFLLLGVADGARWAVGE